MKKVTLVTTQECAYCPHVDKLWRGLKKKYSFEYSKIDASTEDGMKLVEKFGILSVPATIIDDKLKFIGVPSREKAEESVKQ